MSHENGYLGSASNPNLLFPRIIEGICDICCDVVRCVEAGSSGTVSISIFTAYDLDAQVPEVVRKPFIIAAVGATLFRDDAE